MTSVSSAQDFSSSSPLNRLLLDIVRREGGFVAHPADTGGPTQWGISLRYAQGIGLDLDGDGDTDPDDVRAVTPAQAMALYRRDFYEAPGFAALPDSLAPVLVDWAVNSGPTRPVLALQRVLNALGQADPTAVGGHEPLVEDGRVGPRTARAARAAVRTLGAALMMNALCDERVAWLRALVARRPSQRVFLAGWLARANGFRQS
ncbi:glycoside hydrolase family 108 protein [Pararhodospirillum oryzae]|uniref:Uncharacterized protein n=1 Tax=Pararhodospirillum oryzae TaxID=478448 RepID=A0A512H778_9PROT|nr:N-acetylmuramidase [Pararhodospirillum oryzae]GEO81313.1 hypothetical protein ROR02_14440 [Pararhodospirillum oryzae]